MPALPAAVRAALSTLIGLTVAGCGDNGQSRDTRGARVHGDAASRIADMDRAVTATVEAG